MIAKEERPRRASILRATKGTEDDDAFDIAFLAKGTIRERAGVLVEELERVRRVPGAQGGVRLAKKERFGADVGDDWMRGWERRGVGRGARDRRKDHRARLRG